ncbi:MAG: hypothetical protein ACKKMO_02740 [Candidatus Nealsonbacteria bacterium]
MKDGVKRGRLKLKIKKVVDLTRLDSEQRSEQIIGSFVTLLFWIPGLIIYVTHVLLGVITFFIGVILLGIGLIPWFFTVELPDSIKPLMRALFYIPGTILLLLGFFLSFNTPIFGTIMMSIGLIMSFFGHSVVCMFSVICLIGGGVLMLFFSLPDIVELFAGWQYIAMLFLPDIVELVGWQPMVLGIIIIIAFVPIPVVFGLPSVFAGEDRDVGLVDGGGSSCISSRTYHYDSKGRCTGESVEFKYD